MLILLVSARLAVSSCISSSSSSEAFECRLIKDRTNSKIGEKPTTCPILVLCCSTHALYSARSPSSLSSTVSVKQGEMVRKKIFLLIAAVSTLSLLLHHGIHSSWSVNLPFKPSKSLSAHLVLVTQKNNDNDSFFIFV